MSETWRRRARRALGWLVGGAAAVGVAVALWNAWSVLTAPPANTAYNQPPNPRYGRLLQDDSGLFQAWAALIPQLGDRSSPEQLRERFHDAGFREIDRLQGLLARHPSPSETLALRMAVAKLYLFEGNAAAAEAVLDETRAAAEATPALRHHVPAVIFLQGVAALRRGETENCVACGCDSSCILPLRPEALHQKPDGSARAAKHFTEFLAYFPGDMAARWLLNLAAMTLGQHPDQVPDAFRLGPVLGGPQGDVGRFTDVAPRLGLNRWNQAGGAILDDFDNSGWLDLVTSSQDPATPLAFYQNHGDGSFVDRSREAGLAGQLGGLNCVQTDYDNDGWLDIFVCRGGWTGLPQRPSLLRNNHDGTFTDMTHAAGWTCSSAARRPAAGCTTTAATAPSPRSPRRPAWTTPTASARAATGATTTATATRTCSSRT